MFKRASYALEAVKMRLNNTKNNGLSLARSGVQRAPRVVVRSGIGWKLTGIHRRSDGQMSNLSGKPTFYKYPFKGYLLGSNDSF